MDGKQAIDHNLLDIYQQQQRIVVKMQAMIGAEGEAANAGDMEALVLAASSFEELTREYQRWDEARTEAENNWSKQSGEDTLNQVRKDLRSELQQAQNTAALQHQRVQKGLGDLKDQHARVRQGKQTLRSYRSEGTVYPRCIDQYR